MFVKSLDEKVSKLNYHKYTSKTNSSSLHHKCWEILIKLYPMEKVFQEVPIEVKKGETLYLDFFLPMKMLAIETQGEQHYSFNLHFHGNRWNYLQSKRRDADKRSWCELNNIRLVELPYNESTSQWIERIKG